MFIKTGLMSQFKTNKNGFKSKVTQKSPLKKKKKKMEPSNQKAKETFFHLYFKSVYSFTSLRFSPAPSQ